MTQPWVRLLTPRLGPASLLDGLDSLTSASTQRDAASPDREVALRSSDEVLDHLVSVLGSQFDLPGDRRGVLDALGSGRSREE